MINILDTSIKEFQKHISDKKIILYGAGIKAGLFYDNLNLKGKISFLIDKNKNYFEADVELPVYTLEEASRIINTKDCILLITPSYHVMEIVAKLDACDAFDGVDCFIGNLLQGFLEKQEFEFTKGTEKIPKKIHYCWFGYTEMPDLLKRCIDSWHKYCPDYEIVRWDENNYDVSKNKYMREAYEAKKWGFVPDYARLDIVYNEGGIYLDTDVELVRSLDEVLCDEMFCAAVGNCASAFGLGFGAVKKHLLIKELRDAYEDVSFFLKNDEMNLKPTNYYQDPILKKFGFSLENRYQKINNVVYYPAEVFNAKNAYGINGNYTENTIAVHHYASSWQKEEERAGFIDYQEGIGERIARQTGFSSTKENKE